MAAVAQLTNIAAAGCDVFFVPQYYNQVPDIVQQAQAQGFLMSILGSDARGDPQLFERSAGPGRPDVGSLPTGRRIW